jgi:hypothetical protein
VKYELVTNAQGAVVGVNVDGVAWAPAPPAPPPVNSVARIQQSMLGFHEGVLHGVPLDYEWAKGPRVQAATPPAGMTAVLMWGQVYAEAGGVVPANVRVAFRNLQTCVLTSSGWKNLTTRGLDGAHFVEDFAKNASVPWDIRSEPDGSRSVDMRPGYNIHFYPAARAPLPASVLGVFTSVQARLVLTDPAGPDNRERARWLCNVGADWWRDLTVPYGDGSNNPGVGQGRFQYLSSAWQAFNFHTLTAAQVAANPPPYL